MEQFQKSTTFIHALEIQMCPMTVVLANRPQGLLPSNTEKNLKEEANTITLQSGRPLEQEQPKNTDAESSKGAKESNKDEQKSQRITNARRQQIHCLNG